MGRKKASERQDDYLYRIVYVVQEDPLIIDVIDRRGHKIQNFTNITIHNENNRKPIDGIREVVRNSINDHKDDNLNIFKIPSSDSSSFDDNIDDY